MLGRPKRANPRLKWVYGLARLRVRMVGMGWGSADVSDEMRAKTAGWFQVVSW